MPPMPRPKYRHRAEHGEIIRCVYSHDACDCQQRKPNGAKQTYRDARDQNAECERGRSRAYRVECSGVSNQCRVEASVCKIRDAMHAHRTCRERDHAEHGYEGPEDRRVCRLRHRPRHLILCTPHRLRFAPFIARGLIHRVAVWQQSHVLRLSPDEYRLREER